MTSAEGAPENQTNLQCPSCGEAVKSTWKVCPACETPLGRRVCPGCSMEIQENWKICPECGRRLMCATCSRRIPAGQSECPACCSNQTRRQEDTGVYIEPVTGMEFVHVPAGMFQMGDLYGDGWDNELPLREVGVESFCLAKYAVTQDSWEKVMGVNPSRFRKGGTYPVEQVTWADADEFIRRLNALTSGGKPFRLPSEAEWEYASRSGGRKELYAGGDDINRVAWYAENSQGSTQAVGLKAPNGLGLYDMSGNIWEWCQDIYTSGAVAAPGPDRPVGKNETRERVIRGGSWNLDAWSARCSRRFGFPEDYFGAGLGFRLAMTAAINPALSKASRIIPPFHA